MAWTRTPQYSGCAALPVTSSAARSGTATLQVRRHLCLYFMRKWRSSITVKTATGGRPSCAVLFTDSITTLSSRATRRCITPVRYFSLSQVQSALNTSSSHSTTARISPASLIGCRMPWCTIFSPTALQVPGARLPEVVPKNIPAALFPARVSAAR